MIYQPFKGTFRADLFTRISTPIREPSILSMSIRYRQPALFVYHLERPTPKRQKHKTWN